MHNVLMRQDMFGLGWDYGKSSTAEEPPQLGPQNTTVLFQSQAERHIRIYSP